MHAYNGYHLEKISHSFHRLHPIDCPSGLLQNLGLQRIVGSHVNEAALRVPRHFSQSILELLAILEKTVATRLPSRNTRSLKYNGLKPTLILH